MNKRQRGRGRKPNTGNNNPNRSLDSNGPDVKVRGSASTIFDKYTTLARDAASSGHRVKAENYLQHAEHYLRLMMEQQEKAAAHAEQQQVRQQNDDNANKEQSGDGEQEQNNGRTRRYPPRRRQPQQEGQDQNTEDVSAAEPESKDQHAVEAANEKVIEKPKPRRKKPVEPKAAPEEGLAPAAE